jgi:hypothetical protein
MPYQTGNNVSVRYKVQGSFGTPATGASGEELPLIASGGLVPQKAAIPSPEIRSDGMTTVGRHGTRSVAGEYAAVARVDAHDTLLEAFMRSTWTAAASITNAAMTSITTTSTTIVAAGGSWITQGVRAGDIVRLTNHSTASNNSKNIPVVSVTTSTITAPAGYLTLDAGADSSFTLTVLRRIGMGTTARYFTFEEYHADIDQSETFEDCVVSRVEAAMQADETVRITYGIVGADFVSNASGASPVLTSPTAYNSANLVATDATFLMTGVAVANLTGFTFTADMGASILPTIGATTSPDVFPNNTRISGSLSVPRADLTWLDDFDDETTFALHIVLVEPEAEPKDCLAFYFPHIKLMSAPDAPLGGDGPMISTINFEAGKVPTTTGVLDTMLMISTSAA